MNDVVVTGNGGDDFSGSTRAIFTGSPTRFTSKTGQEIAKLQRHSNLFELVP
jgi:hypothetical protein